MWGVFFVINMLRWEKLDVFKRKDVKKEIMFVDVVFFFYLFLEVEVLLDGVWLFVVFVLLVVGLLEEGRVDEDGVEFFLDEEEGIVVDDVGLFVFVVVFFVEDLVVDLFWLVELVWVVVFVVEFLGVWI